MSTPTLHVCLTSGVRGLDLEHGVQAGLLDALNQARRHGRDTAESRFLLARFVDYASMHVVSEHDADEAPS